MAIDVTGPRSRRSLITAALGGAAAAAAAALAGAQRVLAGGGNDGDAVLIGQVYSDVRTTTVLTAQSANAVDSILAVQGEGGNGGLRGSTLSGKGVYGLAFGNGWGVFGASTGGSGVHGICGEVNASIHYPAAVLGEAKLPAGVSILGNNYATHGHAQGVQGSTSSPAGYANTGWATAGGTALVGVSGPDFPSSSVPAKTGVYGYSKSGRGMVAQGHVSQLRLVPASGSHPASGQAGDLFMDHANKLWLCKGGSSWHQLA